MTKIEILEATEKSVGPTEMYNWHLHLKTLQQSKKELKSKCDEKEKHIEKLRRQNERNRQEMQRHNEYQDYLNQITLLEKKKHVLDYEAHRAKFEMLREQVAKKKAELNKAKDDVKPKIRLIENWKAFSEKCRQNMVETDINIKKLSHVCKVKQDSLYKKDDEIEEARQSLNQKKSEFADCKKKKLSLRKLLEQLELERTSLEEEQDVQLELRDTDANLSRTCDKMMRLELELRQLQDDSKNAEDERKGIQQQIQILQNQENMRLEKLRLKYHDTHEAVMWLKQNKGRFQGQVFEPIMLLMRDEKHLRVNAVRAPGVPSNSFKPSYSLDDLKKRPYCFVSYLRELFDAPDAIVSYLCQRYRVHDVPVGTQTTKENVEQVTKTFSLRNFYTPESRFAVKKSFYSGQIITSNTALREPRLLTEALDVEQCQQLQKQLQLLDSQIATKNTQIDDLHGKHRNLSREDNELRKRKKQLGERKSKCRALEQRIHLRKESLMALEASKDSLEDEELQTKQKIRKILNEKGPILVNLVELNKKKLPLLQDKSCSDLSYRSALLKQMKEKGESEEVFKVIAYLQEEYDALKMHMSSTRKEGKEILEVFRKLCCCTLSDLSKAMLHQLSQLPNDIDEIDASIIDARARADCYNINMQVVDEFVQRLADIEKMTEEVRQLKDKLQKVEQDNFQAKEKWLAPLQLLVDEINKRFSSFFASMDCVGQVDLHYENEEEYDTYGIRIQVKFRSASKLAELTPFHQSGGERSVSTMLYLLALQELNKCPFRVVDEINQGMDPTNERRVFDIIVNTVSINETSQYFFITPKLLPDLPCNDKMTVHCVFNGPHVTI
uniref:Structural maintenance of chromosomes protein 5 n=1 Tax=Eptatretus burgeri TaxID=7764 RepID=A0A8C4QBP7_EPTBU